LVATAAIHRDKADLYAPHRGAASLNPMWLSHMGWQQSAKTHLVEMRLR